MAKGDLTPAQQLRQAQRGAMSDHWELTLLQQMRAEKMPVPEREHRFHPTREWRFDFAWPSLLTTYGEERRIAVEVEGGTGSRGVSCGRCRGARSIMAHGFLVACTACRGSGRMAGRHNSSKGYEGDLEKYNQATIFGWCVYRFSSEMIKDGRAIRFLCDDVFKFIRR